MLTVSDNSASATLFSIDVVAHFLFEPGRKEGRKKKYFSSSTTNKQTNYNVRNSINYITVDNDNVLGAILLSWST